MLLWLCLSQLAAEAAAKPTQEQEAQQASVQEIQALKDSLSQAEAQTRELEAQLENVQKVRTRCSRVFISEPKNISVFERFKVTKNVIKLLDVAHLQVNNFECKESWGC